MLYHQIMIQVCFKMLSTFFCSPSRVRGSNSTTVHRHHCDKLNPAAHTSGYSVSFPSPSSTLLHRRSSVYLIPWTLGWSCSRPVCSSPGSPPWPWCRQRDSCILGIGPSTGTSSHCCGRATRPLSCTPHSWGLPPQNAHAETLAGHLVSLEKKQKPHGKVFLHF